MFEEEKGQLAEIVEKYGDGIGTIYLEILRLERGTQDTSRRSELRQKIKNLIKNSGVQK